MTENKDHVILVGGVYRHFKGGYYVVWGLAENAETGENTIIYRESNRGGLVQSHAKLYTRSVADWFKDIEGEYSDDINVTGQKVRFRIENQSYHGENDAFMGNQVIHIKERPADKGGE